MDNSKDHGINELYPDEVFSLLFDTVHFVL